MVVVYGVPKEMRVQVWKKFLRIDTVIMKEFRVSEMDNLTFEQIDQDIKFYKFQPGYLSNLTETDREK